jgi:hypothetical protein
MSPNKRLDHLHMGGSWLVLAGRTVVNEKNRPDAAMPSQNINGPAVHFS